jgi:hypothetical protein
LVLYLITIERTDTMDDDNSALHPARTFVSRAAFTRSCGVGERSRDTASLEQQPPFSGGRNMRFYPFRIAVVLAAAFVLSTSYASAAPTTESTPIPMPPKPDWSSMKFLIGTWNCSSQSSRRPGPYLTTATTTADPTGYWLVTKSIIPKVSWAMGLTSTDSVTYDADQHRWVDVYSDDNGGYDVTFSPGWSAGTIVWTDALFAPGPDIIAASPVTITKVSDTKTTAHSSFKEKSGRTITLDTVCNKAM